MKNKHMESGYSAPNPASTAASIGDDKYGKEKLPSGKIKGKKMKGISSIEQLRKVAKAKGA